MSTNTLPTQDHKISLAAAATMTKRYRDNLAVVLASGYSQVLPLNETFSKTAVNGLLNNTGCEGLRIYYGMDESLNVHAILVGVNEENEDILPEENGEGEILEDSQRCPPICPPSSPLN